MKELYISVDPGFDSLKVVANGKMFKFPFNIKKTYEKRISDYGITDEFILYKSTENETWRIGQYARDLIYENKNDEELQQEMASFYTEKRFLTEEFLIVLRTSVALALNKLNLVKDMEKLNIFIMVALPHGVRDSYSTQVKNILEGIHNFELRNGKNDFVKYSFQIKTENIFTISQTIAAILGETSDDEGNIDDNKFYYLSNGPTLVIDGGYYTVGIVPISRGGTVDEDMTTSDTDHAMKNVNIAMAESLKDKRPDIKYYVIEYLLSKNEGKLKYIKDGKAEIIDLNEIKREKIKEVCNDFINNLNNHYNNLLDFNYVLITGGTGAQFFEHLKEYYVDSGIMEKDRFILTNNIFNDKKFNIEFSISVGAYKGLRGKTMLTKV